MLEVLREIFGQGPSAEGWARVCEAVGVGAVAPYALEYAQAHLEGWPAALREAPRWWSEALLAGARLDGWSLARVALFEQAKAGDAAKLLKLPQMAQMTGLRFHGGALGPKAGIKALVGSPHLGQVRSLALEGCLIGDQGAEEIFGSALAARCEALRFEAGVTYNPRSLLSTVASLEALSRATGMVALRSLSVEGSFLWAGEGAVRALAEAPHLGALEEVGLGLGVLVPVDAFLQRVPGERLRSLGLRGAKVGEPSSLEALERWPLERLSMDLSAFDSAAHVRALCGLSLPRLRSLELVLEPRQSIRPLLEAPWASQLRSLTLDGVTEPAEVGLLATHPSLSGLESLTVRQDACWHWSLREEQRAASALKGPVLREWLDTEARPALSGLRLELPVALSQGECEAALGDVYAARAQAPPYPAWGALVGFVEQASGVRFPRVTALPVASRSLIEITVQFDDKEERLEALRADGSLAWCQSLWFKMHLEGVSPALLCGWFGGADFGRLEVLEISSELCNPYRWSAQGQAILEGLLANPTLGSVRRFVYTHSNHDERYLPILLKLRASSSLPASVRESIDPRRAFSGFSFAQAEVMRVLCGCPELSAVRSLDFSGVNLMDDAVSALAGCGFLQGLEVLNLSRTLITDVGALALAASPHLRGLRELALGHTRVSAEGLRALSEGPHLSAEVRAVYARKYQQALKKLGKK